MAMSWDKNGEAGEARSAATNSHAADAFHGRRMTRGVGGYTEKLIEYSPGGVPSVWTRPPALNPVAAPVVELGVRVGGVDQQVGVNGEH
jgi:hypothetical protein